MTFPNLFRLYIWLVDQIRRSNGLTLEEINDRWSRTSISDGEVMSRSSFLRHKNEISDIFGINIVCTRDNGYRYYLEDRDLLKNDTVQNWMISTLSVSNVLSEGLSLNDRIALETIPSSNWLPAVIEAMKKSAVLKITYKKYQSAQEQEYEVEPYSLKLSRRRWYMLCKKRPSNEFRTFSLDRIINLEQTYERFEMPPNFSASDFYKECYGIVHGTDTEAEHIVLRAFEFEAKQMRDLPIHGSQKVLDDSNEHYTDYELYLRPTSDFVSHILERGRWLQVLEPSWLADKVAEEHRKAAAIYGKTEGEEKE